MKLVLFILLTFSSAMGAEQIICNGKSIYPDPRISVEKIVLTFPQEEHYKEFTDMRLEVVGLFTDVSSSPMHWWEEDKEFFVYSFEYQKVSFAWGEQHYGELYTNDEGKSFEGEITISKNYDFKVSCKKSSL